MIAMMRLIEIENFVTLKLCAVKYDASMPLPFLTKAVRILYDKPDCLNLHHIYRDVFNRPVYYLLNYYFLNLLMIVGQLPYLREIFMYTNVHVKPFETLSGDGWGRSTAPQRVSRICIFQVYYIVS